MGSISNIISPHTSHSNGNPFDTPNAVSSENNLGRTALSQIPVDERPRLWNINSTFPQDLPPRPPKRTLRSNPRHETRSVTPAVGTNGVRQQTVPTARRWSDRHPDVEANGYTPRACCGWISKASRTCRDTMGDVLGVLVVMFVCLVGIIALGTLISGIGYSIWLVTRT